MLGFWINRLEACRLLGMVEIQANVFSLSSMEAELIEIDENLIRQELTTLELCEQLARRKEIYEAIYPETAHGRTPGNKGGNGGKVTKDADSASLVSFAWDAAKTTGMSKRTVLVNVQIGANMTEEAKEAPARHPYRPRHPSPDAGISRPIRGR